MALKELIRQCIWCGAFFTPRAGNQKRCSRLCTRIDGNYRKGNRRRGGKLPLLINCGICGQEFKPFSIVSRYCSWPCKSKAKDQRRAHRSKIKRQRIYDRDKGICQLCFCWVDQSIPYPHSKAFTIDHIIPVSAGGLDDENNLQTAHMDCNSGKGGVMRWLSL